MPASSDKKALFTFGEFTIDVAHRELRSAGEPVVLQPRVYGSLSHGRGRAMISHKMVLCSAQAGLHAHVA